MFPRFLLLFVLVGRILAAAPPQPRPPAPRSFDPARLRIEPAGMLELGSLGPREVRLQRYLFSNTSQAPISLRVFELSPGVSVSGPALQAPIPAQAAAELVLRVDPTGWVGPQSRNVKLGTDDPRQGSYYLPVELRVRPDLTVDGVRRDFGDLAVPGTYEQVFSFTRETGEPVLLRVAQALPPYLELEIRQGKNSAQLALTLRSERVPPGALLGFEELRVETNAALQPRFDLYLSWKLHHPIAAVPSRLVFQGPQARELELKLKGHDGKPFQILGAELEGEGFQLGPIPEGPAIAHSLSISRTALAQAQAMLVLHFQGEEAPLRVPLAFVP